MSSDATLGMVGPGAEVAILETQLVIRKKIRLPIGQYFSVEEIRMHVGDIRRRNDILAGTEFRSRFRRLQIALFRTGRAGARFDWIKYVRRQATFVADAYPTLAAPVV